MNRGAGRSRFIQEQRSMALLQWSVLWKLPFRGVLRPTPRCTDQGVFLNNQVCWHKRRITRIQQKLRPWSSNMVQHADTNQRKAAPEDRTSRALLAEEERTSGVSPSVDPTDRALQRLVLITGFEKFNVALYREAADEARRLVPALEVLVFTDRELQDKRGRQHLEQILRETDAVLCSLLFDFDAVEWLRERISHISVRLVYESSLELMACTRVGSFSLGDNKRNGTAAMSGSLPNTLRSILSKLGLGGREEDKMAGYLSFLKTGPKLLKYIPFGKAQDLRRWLEVYARWNAGGRANIVSMIQYIAKELLGISSVTLVPETIELPAIGVIHPRAPSHAPFFRTPAAYLEWYLRNWPQMGQCPRVGLLLYRKHVLSEQPYIRELILALEESGILPIPVFINGVEAHMVVRDLFTTSYELERRRRGIRETPLRERDAARVDVIVSTIGFPLVGGPAGTMRAGRQTDVARRLLAAKNVPYIVAAPLLIQDLQSWRQQGVIGLQSIVLYALPELDGAIDTIVLGGLVGDRIVLVPDRVRVLAERIRRWSSLARKPNHEKRIAIIVYGFPPGAGATGTAALLNVPRSLNHLLRAMRDAGFHLGNPAQCDPFLEDDSGELLLREIRAADQVPEGSGIPLEQISTVNVDELRSWLPEEIAARVEKNWGGSLTRSDIKRLGQYLCLGGVSLGNIWLGVQPPLGVPGDPMRLLFERDATPHPQYLAFYLWIRRNFDAVIHLGMHGTAEWLPGLPLGNDEFSFPDLLFRDLPNIYVYAQNNPSESTLAKRRAYATLVSHSVPPYGRAGLYGQLLNVRDQLRELEEELQRQDQTAKTSVDMLAIESLRTAVERAGLDADLPMDALQQTNRAELEAYVSKLKSYLAELENRLFAEGLHVLGMPPSQVDVEKYLAAVEEQHQEKDSDPAVAIDRKQLVQLLQQRTEEVQNILRALEGHYIPAAPGGDLIRDGPAVLPTGRNIHALDPYRVPSLLAFRRGAEIALAILAQHQEKHPNSFPETVAVMLWGLDSIKTRGESIGTVLELVGARPVREATGRVVRFELVPLSEMTHPRIDVLCSLSGIFRDAFEHVVGLLDELFAQAASAPEETPDQNYIKKHFLADGAREDRPRRLWSNPPAEFGSLVADRVETSTWQSGDELADTFVSRNAFSYGRSERGVQRQEELERLLSTVDRVVQQVDSVEYGITDIQEYYANTGALARAAQTRKRRAGGDPDAKVTASFVESFGNASSRRPRDLEELLRLEYRSKLLNPRWAEKMVAQGSGGAYEVSQRMTALLGWGGVSGFGDSFVYEQAADQYALNEDIARRIREYNPEAFRNIVGRLLEAAGRGIWRNADEERLAKLRALYEDIDAQLEGVSLS
jgi:magnesium chelatase subunit H